MTEPVSFAEAKWKRETDTRKHSVVDMLTVAIAQIERGEIDADHAFLCVGSITEENAVNTNWFQAGKFNAYAQIGLLERCKLDLIACATRE